MVLIGAGRPVPLRSLVDGLSQAAQGVVRVGPASGLSGLCTGWLLTDDLVVVPGYALTLDDADSRWTCWMDGGRLAVPAVVIHQPPESEGLWPALLRLATPRAGAALSLEMAIPRPDERLLVLHHPRGLPEVQVSLGRVLGVGEDGRLLHDAATEPGSGGAPVLDAGSVAVLGMTVTGAEHVNGAVPLPDLLAALRESSSWPEIAAYQRLAEASLADRGDAGGTLTAARSPQSPGSPKGSEESDGDLPLVTAALQWAVDPEHLPPASRERVRALVGDPDAPRWSLLGAERRRLAGEAGSLDELRHARERARDVDSTEPGQRVIDRILAGPPYDLAEVGDADLSYWLQAVDWFGDVVPDLPTAADVHRALSRRRLRGRLAAVAGPALRGREAQLAHLRAWYERPDAGPLTVTGIGGLGKSALVGRFALDLPESTVLLWLDFDRADLAPDDAVSVLRALIEQAALQVDGDAPADHPEWSGLDPGVVTADDWEDAAARLGAALAAAADTRGAPLLVLDGFEIAQHVVRYDEIWHVLARALSAVPAAHVVVSGRAPVPGLTLHGRPAEELPLPGLPEHVAEAWLRERGITDQRVLADVLDLADGVPLLLKLAGRLVAAGGAAETLPERLPRALVEGYLYSRILDRVVDRQLRPLARDALVLRRLSLGLVAEVLADRLPAGRPLVEVLGRLARELALVESLEGGPGADRTTTPEDPGPLRLRREVRAATLRLLEHDDPERVRELDRRAAEWYERFARHDDVAAAEAVYHRLRLGDVSGAEATWRDGCAPHLDQAEDDIPDTHVDARRWLTARLRSAPSKAAISDIAGAGREEHVLRLIREALSRGNLRAVSSHLASFSERRPGSPLLAYDAWLRWSLDDDAVGGLALLRKAPAASGWAARDRAVVAAALAAAIGDAAEADRKLAALEDPRSWEDRPDGAVAALAARAARVRLTVDLEGELGLDWGERPDGGRGTPLRALLTPADLVLPSSHLLLLGEGERERILTPISIPESEDEVPLFVARLERRRLQLLGEGRAHAGPLPEREQAAAVELLESARRRWALVSSWPYLRQVREASRVAAVDALTLSVVATLATLGGEALAYRDGQRPADVLRDASLRAGSAVGITAPHRDGLAWTVLAREWRASGAGEQAWRVVSGLRDFGAIMDTLARYAASGSVALRALWDLTGERGLADLSVYLLGPDPIEILCRRVLGVPDSADVAT